MRSYILIIISAMSLGFGNVFYKKSTSEIGPLNTTFYYYAIGTLLSFILWLAFKNHQNFSIKDMLYPGIIAILLFISVFTFNIGLLQTKLSVSSTIRAFSFIFSVIVAVIFLREQLSFRQIIGVILAGVSLLLLIG